MSLKDDALYEIQTTRHFFNRSTRCLAEADSGFRATPDTMTAAQQVAHTAQTIDWLRAGMFDDNWDMDFERGTAATQAFTSLTAARKELDAAWDRLQARVEQASEEELGNPLADNPILGVRPRHSGIKAVVDHSGHHRGALAVYARLAGKVPEMPYGD
ncbi:MAG: DinB family protein [Thermoanaerobaculia bacterium]|jgi:uncharacterized damage-inducible protein DinB|nr:DinB family protein [Thermoanaerobaculia bacterium]MBP9824405.1 DinB family protein [Thermoanaerobaculia bacterium]